MPGHGAHSSADVPAAADSSTITPLVPITQAGSTIGLELMSTTTSGLPVSRETPHRASSSAFCPPCNSSVAVDRVSPIIWMVSPTTATTRSEHRAFSTASSISAWSIAADTPIFGRGWPSGKNSPSGSGRKSMMFAPREYTTSHSGGASWVNPSSTVVIMLRGWPCGIQSTWPELPAQSPSCAWASSASGPMTAMRWAL